MNKHQEFILKLQLELTSELEGLLNPLTLSDIGSAAEFLYPFLCQKFKEVLVLNCNEFIENSEVCRGKVSDIKIHGKYFDIVVREALLNSNEVEIAFIERGNLPPKNIFINKKILLDSDIKLASLEFYIPKLVKVEFEFLAEVAKVFFETGFSWLEQQFLLSITEKSISAGILYSHLHTVIRNKELTKTLWLVSSTDENGVYLLDSNLVKNVINKLKINVAKSKFSPIQLVTEILTEILPLDQTNGKVAVSTGRCVDFDLNESSYSDEKGKYLLSEQAVFGTSKLSLYPIKRDAPPYFFAIFPTENKSIIEPILNANKLKLSNDFISYTKRFNKLLSLLSSKKKNISAGTFGEFIGGVISSILKGV